MKIRSVGVTDKGQVRPHNEDHFLINADLDLYVVADGMGGHEGGEHASAAAIDFIERLLENVQGEESIASRLIYALRRTNTHVFDTSPGGTTAVVVMMGAETATVAHVGDSRAYRIRDGAIRRMTKDHSLVQQLVDAGLINENEASTHPRRNYVTRALGHSDDVEVDVRICTLREGDRWLLCSDGLSGQLRDAEILKIVRSNSLENAVQALVDAANASGGDDNITAVLIEAV